MHVIEGDLYAGVAFFTDIELSELEGGDGEQDTGADVAARGWRLDDCNCCAVVDLAVGGSEEDAGRPRSFEVLDSHRDSSRGQSSECGGL